MTQQRELLQAILDHPDDDQLRLIYADWLEEHGDVRGEFIRVQTQLAALPRTHPNYRALWNRELELIRTYKEEWFGAMRQRFLNWDVQRGFINEVTAHLHEFMKLAKALFAAHPVEKLVLNVHGRLIPPEQCAKLLLSVVASPWLQGLTKLEISNPPRTSDDAFGIQLAERGTWPRLKALRLDSFQMTAPTAARLREVFGKRLTLVVPNPAQRRGRRR